MANPLDSTQGIWLVSLFVATILYGIGLAQTYLYFHWYGKDHWVLKIIVSWLVVLETLHITFFFCGTYSNLVWNFGNFEALNIITWFDSAQLLAGYLSAFTVQMYFAYCIYILRPKYKIVPAFIAALALLQIGAGIAQTILTTELGLFSELDQTKRITTLQAASALVCDISITASLLYTLRSKRGTLESTNSLLHKLMVMAVNRGVITALSAALNMILFLGIPDTFWFFIGLIPSGKLYMNSMLATLNTRRHIRNVAYGDTRGWQSIPIGALSGNPSEGVTITQTVHTSGTNVEEVPYSNDDGKKGTFAMELV